MSREASSSSVTGLVCPECLTFNPPDAAACAHCHHTLTCVREHPRWSHALSLPRQAKLHITLRWLGTERHLTLDPHQHQSIPLGEGASLEITFDGNPFHCAAKRAGEPIEITLPGTHICGDVEICARAFAASPSRISVPAIERFCPDQVAIDVGTPLTLGRRSDGQNDPCKVVPDSAVEMDHALFVCRYPRDDSNGRKVRREFWIVDLDTPGGTFVDRQPIVSQRLVGGNLIQIDGYAWIFNEEDAQLIPVAGINGADLLLSKIAVDGRLAPVSLSITSGQMVAIAGQSGAGKSTLMHTILGNVRGQASGSVAVGGISFDGDPEAYRAQLGFVPQEEVLHADLTVRQSIEYRADLRREARSTDRPSRGEITELLSRLEIPQSRWEALPTQLSGGESKRARIASELISKPRLLLLDEPASGLDQGREIQLMRLLRGLSNQGCTVIVITHGLAHLEFFDRVLLVLSGDLKFDGTPDQLRERIPSGEFTDLDLAEPPEFRGESSPVADNQDSSKHLKNTSALHQFRILFSREFAKMVNRRLLTIGLPSAISTLLSPLGLVKRNAKFIQPYWLFLPLLLVPAFFAFALHFGIHSDDQFVLPFFAILASIWMGASLSLLSIVNERTSFEHESVLFLHLWPFVAAKTLSLWLISAVQTLVFVGLLEPLRYWTDDPGLPNAFVAFVVLVLTGWAAVGMGMVISAVSGKSSSIANFLLPLMMILQIVFSAEVAGKGGNLQSAYGSFHLHRCEGKTNCVRRVEHRVPTNGQWLCEVCRGKLSTCRKTIEHKANASSVSERGIGPHVSAELRRCLDEQAVKSPSYDQAVNEDLPTTVAIAISYGTLSRYGDMALRSLDEEDPQTRDENGYNQWFWEAISILVVLAFALPGVTWFILWVQAGNRHSRLKRYLAHILPWRATSQTKNQPQHSP
ncbi:hypothetical protein C5Y96_14990 [Blastopirellula marina]|uniref:ABC transporter domain-containing protein n=1 Tax=Blastopirellula marina TaxID=124 RepID=A0A2S8FF45_9BACT|nr:MULTISPECIES: ATP-binding cassette domain-containing protein [Pirellulaceae]PQO30762.1 hypothetical protein C5Y96_14990 [Blastopirellula marina]RCS50899.1 ATP-binding cassette domain-containing protein [Bremerella cremea]